MDNTFVLLMILLVLFVCCGFLAYSVIQLKEKSEQKVEVKQDNPPDIPSDYNNNMYGFSSTAIPRNFLKSTNESYKRTRPYRKYISSLDAELADNLGYHSVDTPWDNIGIATSKDENDNTIFQLFKRAIDPFRDWYSYRLVNKNGVVIPLGININYLEDGDSIGKVTGYEGKGEIIVHIFDNYKYVYL